MRVIIVEDELASRKVLKSYLERYFKEIEILASAGSNAKAIPLIQKYKPDLVFLDIEMPNGDGFGLLKHFNPVPFKVIFTTAFEEYAIRALRLSAVDYLLKPIDLDELKAAVEKAKAVLFPEQEQQLEVLQKNYFGREPRLSLATNEGYIFIKIESIIRCKADGRYTIFYLDNGSKHITVKNIGEFDAILREFDFLRVHRSEIINLNKIKKYIKGRPARLILDDETKVMVSNSHKNSLLNFLGLD